MATQIEDISIAGLKKADIVQLKEMFHYTKDEGVYWGRKDYWSKRVERLTIWLDKFESLVNAEDTIIKEQ